MARTTRSKGPAPASKSTKPTNSSTTSKYTLPAEATHPSKLLILPRKASSDAKVVSLPNPRYARPTRYLVCPETGFYEFTRIAAPKTDPRSWLIDGGSTAGEPDEGTPPANETQITQHSDLFIASAIDPLFLVLPALAKQTASKSDPPKRMFLTSDDHIDALPQEESHLSEVLGWGRIRRILEGRMEAVCDTVDGGDEPLFRLSEKKLLREILAKAQRMSAGGLPPSMEEKFVRKALEAPVVSQRSTAGTNGGDSAAENGSQPAEEAEGVNGDVTTAMQASPEVVGLQRLRVAFNFICSSYLPPALAAVLKVQSAEQKEVEEGDVDFGPLDEYLVKLAKARQDATLARSASDFSRKRMRDEEDEERAEKKRKKEEEDKRKKASESRGVRDLKKVNVSGMKKMSDFFKKKA